MSRSRLVVVLAVAAASLLVAASAFADPTGAKGSFTAWASCDNGMSVPVVVNSADGQGGGTQNGTQAGWTPAHVVGSSLIFHPATFNLTFTFTPAGGGQSQSQSQTASRPNGPGVQTTCQISGSQTDPQGDTFTLSGTVAGWLS
jgi:hypothetical protein